MSEQQTLSDYLPTIKEGDKVLLRGSKNIITKHGVAKVTKTQIVINGNKRFKLNDGSEIGGIKYAPLMIVVPTEENRQAELAGRLERWAKGQFPEAFAKLSTDQQLEIYKSVTAQVAALQGDPLPER
ncbi:hypothetical protein [Pseudomonas sp. P9(2020)]|uniref:hypothetical protein n=1 Tax=Pseudomonas sp. P9(2020) TaxID=2763316 RepID=UPI001B322F60|nr:hypothetical protein [Pseudomonas sp. P9(2020)]MBP5947937.1 hypothetical protein [Pseudomonas sp. P9(2020)]